MTPEIQSNTSSSSTSMSSTKRPNPDHSTSTMSSALNSSSTTTSICSGSSNSNKKTKRWPLHVEVVVHPCCPISFQNLEIEVEQFVKSVGQSSFMYQEGIMDLSKASQMIQKSCLEIAIVDIPSSTHSITVPLCNNENGNGNRNGTNNDDPDDASNDNKENKNHRNQNMNTQEEKSTQDNQVTKKTNRKNHTNNNNHDRIQTQSSIASWSISKVIVHCHILSTEDAEPEEIDDTHNDDEAPITVCTVLPLPHQSLHTSWENLIYPHYIKENIIGYAETSLLFSHKNVSSHVLSWNRVLLLHGPPGSGKTSLCRALAHKLSIRLNHIFTKGGYLLEVKSHSLFSKWFSESGKLISKLFDRVREMVEDEPNALFCVLMDEVESLASSRTATGGSGSSGGGSAGEPSDAVRAVNSVLTSLDSIRNHPNVLILTTTNITDSIDSAFVDRVDLKQYIGHPCLEARYEILRSCLMELIKVGIVDSCSSSKNDGQEILRSFTEVYDQKKNDDVNDNGIRRQSPEILLMTCAKEAENLSGRSLRKLPFQSHAFFVRSYESTPLDQFLIALRHGIEKEKSSRSDLSQR